MAPQIADVLPVLCVGEHRESIASSQTITIIFIEGRTAEPFKVQRSKISDCTQLLKMAASGGIAICGQ